MQAAHKVEPTHATSPAADALNQSMAAREGQLTLPGADTAVRLLARAERPVAARTRCSSGMERDEGPEKHSQQDQRQQQQVAEDEMLVRSPPVRAPRGDVAAPAGGAASGSSRKRRQTQQQGGRGHKRRQAKPGDELIGRQLLIPTAEVLSLVARGSRGGADARTLPDKLHGSVKVCMPRAAWQGSSTACLPVTSTKGAATGCACRYACTWG